MNPKSGWTMDQKSRHIAHESGLYAYYSERLTKGGAIRCVGPFSSYSNRLTRDDVFKYAASAIELLESTVGNGDSYTLWGSYAEHNEDFSTSISDIDVLDSTFRFLPNPCFRSSTILRKAEVQRAKLTLLREWTWDTAEHRVSHRIGLSFRYVRQSKNEIGCYVSTCSEASDLDVLDFELRPLFIRSLGTTALSILHEMGCSDCSTYKGKLLISVD